MGNSYFRSGNGTAVSVIIAPMRVQETASIELVTCRSFSKNGLWPGDEKLG